MPSLQVRELPEPIYRKLQKQAKKEHRSFSQQAVITIAKGLEMDENPKERRAKVIERIFNRPIEINKSDLIAPVDLIREDRNR